MNDGRKERDKERIWREESEPFRLPKINWVKGNVEELGEPISISMMKGSEDARVGK